jgi:hypothetical protein
VESAETMVRTAVAEALAPIASAEPQRTAVGFPFHEASAPLAPPERAAPVQGAAGGRGASLIPASRAPVQAPAFEALRVAPAGQGSNARTPPRRHESAEAPAGAVVPQRPLPPAPPPERPDLSSPSQGGGQGPLMPLVLAALAAAFALFGFQRHGRLLPVSAFRKPRRLALEVWHPG